MPGSEVSHPGAAVQRTLSRIALNSSLKALIPLALAMLNPFGLSDWTSARSYDIWQHVEAVIYGSDTQKGRNALTVVYLDQPALGQMGQTSPSPNLPLSVHGMMIDDLLSTDPVEVHSRQITPNPPAALFVDLLLDGAATAPERQTPIEQELDGFLKQIGGPSADALCNQNPANLNQIQSFECYLNRVAHHTNYDIWRDNPRCQDNIIAKIECINDKGGIPVFFADPGLPGATDPRETLDATPALRALDTVAATVSVNTNTKSYGLVDPTPCKDRHHKLFHLTPAAALYAAFCVANPGECKANPVDSAGVCRGWDGIARKKTKDHLDATWSQSFDRPILVTWGEGVRTDTDYDNFYAELAEKIDAGSILYGCSLARRDIWSLLKRGAEAFEGTIWPVSKNPCYYSHSLSYADFLGDSMSIIQKAQALDGFPFDDQPNRGIRTLIILGGQFGRLNDAIPTYANHAVPGIYYHAMATDNLITFGDKYFKPPRSLVPGLSLNDDAVYSAITMFIFSFAFGGALVTLNSFARPRDGVHVGENHSGASIKLRKLFFAPGFARRYLKISGYPFLMRQLTGLVFGLGGLFSIVLLSFWPGASLVHPFDALGLFLFVFALWIELLVHGVFLFFEPFGFHHVVKWIEIRRARWREVDIPER